jgi:hypothetical protein
MWLLCFNGCFLQRTRACPGAPAIQHSNYAACTSELLAYSIISMVLLRIQLLLLLLCWGLQDAAGSQCAANAFIWRLVCTGHVHW